MDEIVKQLFDEIPKSHEAVTAVKILKENTYKIKHRILEIANTTIKDEEQKLYTNVYHDFIHTIKMCSSL